MPENNLLDFDGYTDSFYNRAIRNLIESFCSVETRRLEDIVSKRLEDEGTNFFGVMIRNYLETGAVKLDGIIKSSLSRSFLYGRRIWVHEIRLNTSNYFDDTMARFEVYRKTHEFNLLLVYDPKNLSWTRNRHFYDIDLLAYLNHERQRADFQDEKPELAA